MINNNHITSNHPQNFNSQMMLDNFKSMILTMTMVKGSTQTDTNTSFINTILIMIVISFIDTIILQINKFCTVVSCQFENYLTNKTNNISILNNITLNNSKTKKSSIIVKIETPSKNPTSDAIIDVLTHLPYTKCILLQNGAYTINYSEEIELTNGIYAKMVSGSTSQIEPPQNISVDAQITSKTHNNLSTSKDTLQQQDKNEVAKHEYSFIDVYSYTFDMETLRFEINNIVQNYLIKMTNKLGNNIYYFSDLPAIVYRDKNCGIDYTKISENLHFTMKQFVTNRSFKNLFGKDIKLIKNV